MSRLVPLLVLSTFALGCAARHRAPVLEPYALSSPPPLEENHFHRDRMGLGEAELRQLLSSPVFLEEHARIGVLPVQHGYAPVGEVPVEAAPAALTDALQESGLFDLASELTAEWPIAQGTAGLRELAARYRAEYVLLYRHRFADDARPNPLAALYATVIGAFVLPGTTLESQGVLEATLFDVKTGTILFTVHERTRQESIAVPLAVEGRFRELHREMVQDAVKKLAAQVLEQCQRLVASRPTTEAKSLSLR